MITSIAARKAPISRQLITLRSISQTKEQKKIPRRTKPKRTKSKAAATIDIYASLCGNVILANDILLCGL